MTVKENVMAAAYGHTQAGIVRSVLRLRGMRREEREIGRSPRRSSRSSAAPDGLPWNQPAYSLSYANRRGWRSPARWRPTRGCSARRARRGHEPGRDARDHGA
jgi:hypothetical protein